MTKGMSCCRLGGSQGARAAAAAPASRRPAAGADVCALCAHTLNEPVEEQRVHVRLDNLVLRLAGETGLRILHGNAHREIMRALHTRLESHTHVQPHTL